MKSGLRPIVARTLVCALAGLAFATHASAVEKTFQYYRWMPTKLRDNTAANSIQVAEFQFYRGGSAVGWSGASVTNPGGSNPTNETPAKIIDGSLTTKWLDFNKGGLIFAFSAATTVDSYRFATANDATERDPVSWTLEGSNDQSTWTLIDVKRNFATTASRLAWQTLLAIPATILPDILSFGPSGTVVKDGSTQTLSWSLDRTDTASIDNGIGSVSPTTGSAPVDPPDNADTTFTLTATNVTGTSTASVVVRSVTGGPVTTRFVRFTPLKLRGATTIQLAEFSFFYGGTQVTPVDVTNPGGSNAASAAEGALKTIDGSTATKWLDANTKPLVFDFGGPVLIDTYRMTTANDASDRDPLRWMLEASDDGSAWTYIENMSTFDFNMPTARYTNTQDIPLPGASLEPIVSASSDFASILVGESLNLSWTSTAAAMVDCDNGVGSLASSGTVTVSPAADTTYTFTATAAGGRTKTATVFVKVANPTVNHIAYSNFDIAGDEINLVSTAAIVNAYATLPQGGNVNRLRLTPDLNSCTGAAWFRYKQNLANGFDCTFDFQFTSLTSDGADGMAFVIHNNSRKTETMPTTTQEFGLGSGALNISLDSYLNTGEASAARLLVLSGGTTLTTVNLAAVPGFPLYTTTQGSDLSDTARTGTPYHVHITYVPGDLDITINNISVVSNLNVDLSAIGALDSEKKAYVGFTSRTGGSFECHDVTAWTFTPLEAGYTNWVGGFPGLSNPAAGADPDHDGAINLMEYVLNGNPAASSTSMLPAAAPDGSSNLVFHFVRRSESKADTTQIFEYSNNLVNWTTSTIPSSSGGIYTVAPDSPSSGLETVTITVPHSAAAAGRLFGRLRATQP